jgi:hypothetical protein
MRKEATAVPAAQVVPSVQPIKLAATITPRAPPPPPNSNSKPSVTKELRAIAASRCHLIPQDEERLGFIREHETAFGF